MKTKVLALAAAVLVLALAGVRYFKAPAPVPERLRCEGCNVVLISIDSLRADHMSLYGYPRKTTSHLERLANHALVFDHFFSTAFLTPISEGSIHTGLYPEVSGLTGFRREFSPEIKTMAEIFKANGYETFALGNSPEFESRISLKRSFGRGFDSYDVDSNRGQSERSIRWEALDQILSRPKDKFFLWLSLGVAHAPFGHTLPNRFADLNYKGPFRDINFFMNMQFWFEDMIYDVFAPGMDFQLVGFDAKTARPHRFPEKYKNAKFPIKTGPEDLNFIVDMYDNGVAQADAQVGKILAALKKAGLMENTVIIIQSEHGETLGERGYIAHYDIWDETTHTPLIFVSPVFKKAWRPQFFVSGVDVLPSVLSHVGIEPPEVDGKSIFQAPDGRARPVRDEIYLTRTPLWESVIRTGGKDSLFDRFRAQDDEIGFKDYAVRTAKGKLIHRTARFAEEQFSCWTYISGKKIRREEYEYYDLAADPGEKNPLPVSAEGASALKAKLDAFEASMKQKARKTAVTPLVQDYQ